MSALAGILCTVSLVLGAFEHTGNEASLYFPVHQVAQDHDQYLVPSCAAALPGRKLWYMHSYYTRPFGLCGMRSHTVTAGARYHSAGIRAGWHRFGIEGYTEDTCTLGIGLAPARFISIGAELHRYILQITTPEIRRDFSAWDSSVSARIVPFSRLSITIEQENLHTLACKKNTGVLFPARHAGLSYRLFEGCNLNAEVAEDFFGYSTIWSVRGVLLPMLTCSIGYSPQLESCSAGFTFSWMQMQVNYSFTHHTYLGNTHAFGVTMYTGKFHYTPIPPSRPAPADSARVTDKPLDIRRCTLEQLCSLQVIDRMYCRRIITYRETMGPVTEKSLYQLGLTGRDISRLRGHLVGLAGNIQQHHAQRRTSRRISLARRKNLFRRLLDRGVPAHTSLQISRMVQHATAGDVEKFISSRTGMSPELKDEVRELCRQYMSR